MIRLTRNLLITFLFTASLTAVSAMSLEEAYLQSLDHDPIFRGQQARYAAVIEKQYQAHAHAYKPVISLSANTNRNYQTIELSRSFGLSGDTNFNASSYSVDLNQPIFHYDRHLQLKQADLDSQKAQFDLDAAHQQLMFRVADVYFGVLIAQDEYEFAQSENKTLHDQLAQTKERFEVGLLAITDLQEAQAGADLSAASVLQASNTLDDRRSALREVIGEVPDNRLQTLGAGFKATTPIPDNLSVWSQQSLENNLQIRAELMATNIAEMEISRQKAGHLPSVDLVGSHGYRESGGMFGTTETDFSLIGVEARLPIYEGGQVNSRTREALHLHEQALEKLIQTQRQIERQCREAFYGVTTGIRLISALEQAVNSSKTAVEATRRGYDVGTRTAVDVVKTEQDLFRARKDYSQAKYQYILDTLRLKMAAGALAPEDLNRISQTLK